MVDLKPFGNIEAETPPIGLIPGRVTELHREQYTVITEQGEVTAVLKGTFYHTAGAREDFPCVGDFVWLQYNENGASCIAKLLPRRSKFSRADFSGHAVGYVKTILEQVVATNFDYVFIVSSLNWDFKVNRIMRYLTQTRQSGGRPVVILTKADLVPDFNASLVDVQKAAPDVPVHAVSDGSLPHEHWERYLAQKRENKFVDDKSGYLMDKRAWHKSLAMRSKQMKKNGGYKK